MGSRFRQLLGFTLALALFAGVAAQARAATSYSAMVRQLRRDTAARPEAIHLFEIGEAAASHRPIYLARISAAPPNRDTTHDLRLLVICRQHGDEPVSTEAALNLIQRCSSEPIERLRSDFRSVTLYIVPMANPDGADKLTRLSGVGADLNRDWGQFTQPETRALYAAFKAIRPQAVIDFHSWTSTDPFQSNSVEAGPSERPANPTALAEELALQSQIIRAVKQETGQSNSSFTYSPDIDTRLCHRFFAQKCGTVSLLVETAAGSDDTSAMAARIAIDQATIGCAIRSMRDDTNAWRKVSLSEQAQIAPATRLTASAIALGGLPRSLLAETGENASPIAEQVKRPADARRAMLWGLGVYLAACVVLLFHLGPLLGSSIRRLRRTSAAPSGQLVYVSTRKRHYPDSRRSQLEREIAAARREC